jgi:RNA polymerase sigma factor (sigma-70 family)
MSFRAVSDAADATTSFRAVSDAADATMSFRAASDAADQLTDTTMQFRLVSEPADATMSFRAVSDAADRLTDATMQFRMIGGPADATMQFRVINEPAGATDSPADVNVHLGQAELRGLIRSILADMKPREREVIELSFRHDLSDNDLAVALGVSQNRAHALASRTRGQLEKSFAALRTALAGRQTCPVMGELLADWDGQLTEHTRDLVIWHMEQCQTCVNQTQGALRPMVFFGLLPSATLPPELREKVLSRCSSDTEDAVAYRRRVIQRAESTWAAIFAQAIRRVSWDSIRANPGPAIATAAVAVWVVAALSVTLLTFAGSHAAYAQAAQPTGSRAAPTQAPRTSAGTSLRNPASATAPTSAAARPSPTITQPSAYVSSQNQPPPSPQASKSPSRSPSPKPSPSRSPSPSPSRSPSPSPTTSASPSSSPSPTS